MVACRRSSRAGDLTGFPTTEIGDLTISYQSASGEQVIGAEALQARVFDRIGATIRLRLLASAAASTWRPGSSSRSWPSAWPARTRAASGRVHRAEESEVDMSART